MAPQPITLTALKYVCINHGGQGVFQFEIINILVSSFCFLLIPMLWVLPFRGGDRPSTSESDVYRPQILTYKQVNVWVYNLISGLTTVLIIQSFILTPVSRPVQSRAISTPQRAYSPAAISVH